MTMCRVVGGWVGGVFMPMPMPMPVGPVQQPRRHQVHHQPDHRHHERGLGRQRLGLPQAQRRFEDDANRHQPQHQGARKAAQHLDLPGAEGIAHVKRMPPRQPVGERRHAQRQRVRAHVPAVGQQRHRAGPPAARDLGHHGDEGDGQHPARARFANTISGIEPVAVLPGAEVVLVEPFACRVPQPVPRGDESGLGRPGARALAFHGVHINPPAVC